MMKKTIKIKKIMAGVFIIFLFAVSCSDDIPNSDDTNNSQTIPNMLYVTGSSFLMGSTTGNANEQPVHNVTLSKFSISKYELSFSEWAEVYDWAMTKGYSFANSGQAGDDGTSGGDTIDEPVSMINWRDAVVWCNAASEYAGLMPVYSYNGAVLKSSTDSNADACDNAVCDWTANGLRLPTEAEWEFSSRGGSSSKGYSYSGSNTLTEVAWFRDNSDSDSHTVGTKTANELGLFDMSGNVWEWCWDLYDTYDSAAQTDPRGGTSGSTRIRRGGGWGGNDISCRSTDRDADGPGSEYNYIGFRLARSL